MTQGCWLVVKTGQDDALVEQLVYHNQTQILERAKEMKGTEEERKILYCYWVVPDEPWPEVTNEDELR